MQISIKYFASLRELIGETSGTLDIEENTTVNDLWVQIIKRKNVEFENVMMTVNMEYVKSERKLKAGDEVAFFPPVTGG